MNILAIDLGTSYGLAEKMMYVASAIALTAVIFEVILLTEAAWRGERRRALSLLSVFAAFATLVASFFVLVPLARAYHDSHKDRNVPKQTRNQRGFAQLLTMLITMLVMEILLCAAMPNVTALIRAQNGQAALSQLRQLADAEGNYEITYHNFYLYPSQLSATAAPNPVDCTKPMVLSGAVNMNFQIGTYRGYQFVFTAGNSAPVMPGCAQALQSWSATATPLNSYVGTRSYYIDQTGIIHVRDDGQRAGVTDSILR